MTNSKPFAKNFLLLFTLLSTTFVGKGQNLVPNGDFEGYISCPNGPGEIDSALYWTNPVIWAGGGSQADYNNKCTANTQIDVPNNVLGYQPAHSGNGYSGIFLYSINWANLREYIQTTLTTPLIAGTCYHFEMYAALADRSVFTTDDLEAYLSTTLMTGITNYYPLPVIPQISNPGIFPDTANWTLISGNFTATGGETYIIIGNFNYDSTTTFINVNNTGIVESYMYIDDVSLTPCTGIEEQNNIEAITIYPNPAKDYLKIKYPLAGEEKAEMKIYDVMGKEVLKTTINNQYAIINVQFIKNGIYFIEINNGKEIYRKKFLKQ